MKITPFIAAHEIRHLMECAGVDAAYSFMDSTSMPWRIKIGGHTVELEFNPALLDCSLNEFSKAICVPAAQELVRLIRANAKPGYID